MAEGDQIQDQGNVQSLDDFLDEMFSDAGPTNPPDGAIQEQVTEEVPLEEPNQSIQSDPQSEVQSGVQSPIEPQRYNFNGQSYTLSELASSGVLSDLVTGATNWQNLIQEQSRQQQNPQSAVQPAQQDPTQFTNNWSGAARNLEASGFLDEGMVDSFPKLSAMVASAVQQMAVLQQEMNQHRTSIQQGEQSRQTSAVQSQFDQAFAKAGQTAGFEELQKKDVQTSIIDYMSKNGYTTAQITPETMQVVYLGAKKEALQEAANLLQSKQQNSIQNSAAMQQAASGIANAPRTPQYEPMLELFQEDINF